ncbi:hypothetical protein BLNAU_6939 [Blattamonas nauphoetae]|uniref:Uncharacterized protein n=1 Tax=Blattamonas nauphoetae TaxID=2049346 RepID=A0ABQ9Y2U0_9EUKA|nr:hypothetical protein BLNAU_6939 [Blattamonas nauphoetae]
MSQLNTSPADLGGFEVTNDDELDDIKKSESSAIRYVKVDKNGPYKLLFPLCSMHHYLREQYLVFNKHAFQKEEKALSSAIDDICIQYGGHLESLTALEHWGLLSVFPLMNVTASGHPSHGRFKTYLDSLSDLLLVVALCENICESIELDDGQSGFTTPNFRYIGHQLALLFHSLKRMAPYFCDDLKGHFNTIKNVWETNFLDPEEKTWLIAFCTRVLESLFAMMQPPLQKPLTSLPSVSQRPDPPPSFLTNSQPTPTVPGQPKPPPPLVAAKENGEKKVTALLTPWEGQEVDPRGSVRLAEDEIGKPVNILGTAKRQTVPTKVIEACRFNNPWEYLLNGVSFVYNQAPQPTKKKF